MNLSALNTPDKNTESLSVRILAPDPARRER